MDPLDESNDCERSRENAPESTCCCSVESAAEAGFVVPNAQIRDCCVAEPWRELKTLY